MRVTDMSSTHLRLRPSVQAHPMPTAPMHYTKDGEKKDSQNTWQQLGWWKAFYQPSGHDINNGLSASLNEICETLPHKIPLTLLGWWWIWPSKAMGGAMVRRQKRNTLDLCCTFIASFRVTGILFVMHTLILQLFWYSGAYMAELPDSNWCSLRISIG